MEALARPVLGRALDAPQLQLSVASFTFFLVVNNVVVHWASQHNVPEYRELSSDGKRHWRAVVTSLLHAVVVCSMCVWIVLFPEVDIEENRIYGYSLLGNQAFAIASGFFLYDTTNCFKSTGPMYAYIAHHLASFLCYTFVQYPFLCYYAVRFLLYELSTPLLDVRSMLLVLKRKDTALFVAVEKTFGLTFFAVRICMGIPLSLQAFRDTYYLFDANEQHSTPVAIFFIFANLGLNALNVHWMGLMFKKALKKEA